MASPFGERFSADELFGIAAEELGNFPEIETRSNVTSWPELENLMETECDGTRAEWRHPSDW